MVANDHRIDVQTEDGTVVLQGDIFDIRDRVIFNYHFYGEPIVHPNAWPLFEDSAANAMRRSMAVLAIEKSVAEYKLGMTVLESDDSGLSETETEVPDLVNDESEPAMADVPMEVDQPLDGAVPKGKMPEDDYRPAAKKHRPDEPVAEDPGDWNPHDPVKTLELHFEPVGIKPKYRYTHNIRDGRCLCILNAGNGVARGKGLSKRRAKVEAAENMIVQLQCGSGPFEQKADGVHGDVEVITMCNEPKLGSISQSDVDAWGESDLRNSLDSFKAKVNGLPYPMESGNAHTKTPRRYGLSLNKKQRLQYGREEGGTLSMLFHQDDSEAKLTSRRGWRRSYGATVRASNDKC
jgi:hypothetical protein